jgi:hypothetical protein
MTKWIGAAMLAFALMFGSSAVVSRATATPLQGAVQKQRAVQKPDAPPSVDLGARRRVRPSTRYAYRAYDRPAYYDRPYYYAPAPYVPLNYGYGFWPWW